MKLSFDNELEELQFTRALSAVEQLIVSSTVQRHDYDRIVAFVANARKGLSKQTPLIESSLPSKDNVGKRLQSIRQLRGLTQREVEKLCGVTAAHVSRYETGFSYPSLPTLMKLCDVYHVGLSDFFNDEKHVQLTSSLVANLSKVSDSDYRLIDKLVQIAAGTTE